MLIVTKIELRACHGEPNKATLFLFKFVKMQELANFLLSPLLQESRKSAAVNADGLSDLISEAVKVWSVCDQVIIREHFFK